MNKSLIEKFIRDRCSPEEASKVLKWLTDPQNEDEVNALMKSGWDKVSGQSPTGPLDSEILFRHILGKVGVPDNNGSDQLIHEGDSATDKPTYTSATHRKQSAGASSGRNRALPHHRFQWIKVAAVIFIALALSLFTYRHLTHPVKDELIIIVERSTLPGQKLTVFLEDGSKVILNAGSTLRYPESFDGHYREVFLSGEAFFEIAEDSLRPFTAVTGNITTTALGTSFNIKAYQSAGQINVGLVTGEVRVDKFSDARHLQRADSLFPVAGEQVVFRQAADQLTVEKMNYLKDLGWKDGIIYFDDTGFTEIVGVLERWYGVQINVSDKKPEEIYFSGEFHNESLQFVLEAMNYPEKFTFRIEGRNVSIDFNN